MREERKKRTRPGLRKSRVSVANDNGGGEGTDQEVPPDLEMLERVQLIQATRKKIKGITSRESALGSGVKGGAEGAEGKDASEQEEPQYGLQVFATEDSQPHKRDKEEERMRKYVEEKLKEKASPQEGGAKKEVEKEEDLKRSKLMANKATPDAPNWGGEAGIAEVPIARPKEKPKTVRSDIKRSDLPTGFI